MTALPTKESFTGASVTEGQFKTAHDSLIDFLTEREGGAAENVIKGSDIASASPLVLGTDGAYFDVTGTTGFSAITVVANRMFVLQFDAALTLTHHATNLDLPGEANITTAAGDSGIFFSTGTNTVQCLSYTKADGTPVVSSPLAANVMLSDTTKNLSVGITTDVEAVSAVGSAGTFTPNMALEYLKTVTCADSFTLAHASNGNGSIAVKLTSTSGGTVTLASGYKSTSGSSLTLIASTVYLFTIHRFGASDSVVDISVIA